MPPEVAAAIVAHARREQPRECCGLLIGSADSGDRAATVVEAYAVRNLADDPNRFLVDPRGHIDGLRSARARGLDVVGFYHSHPHSPAQPSARDREEGAYSGPFYVIVSLAQEPPDLRLFRLEGGEFLEVETAVG
jgi:proteasome lid subunit RPN8/RPN11